MRATTSAYDKITRGSSSAPWTRSFVRVPDRLQDVCALVYLGKVKDPEQLAAALRAVDVNSKERLRSVHGRGEYSSHVWCRDAIYVRFFLSYLSPFTLFFY